MMFIYFSQSAKSLRKTAADVIGRVCAALGAECESERV